jgi:hypothetical protein
MLAGTAPVDRHHHKLQLAFIHGPIRVGPESAWSSHPGRVVIDTGAKWLQSSRRYLRPRFRSPLP